MSTGSYSDRNIYSNEEFQELVAEFSKEASVSVTIFSAFIKLNAMQWLSDHIHEDTRVKIIARWRPEDLAFKASDLGVYVFCKSNGWEFGIDSSLHSKAFIFDSSRVLLGSANLTDRGLSLSRNGNLEMGAVVEPTIADMDRLKTLESRVFWINDDVFNDIHNEIANLEHERPKSPSWSSELKKRLSPTIDFLWVNELFHTEPNSLLWPDFDNEEHLHDAELLGLGIESFQDQMKIKNAFLGSRMYLWFKSQLRKDDAVLDYASFGWLTEKLHNALLDDPPPFRSGVKQYVADFVEWLKAFALEEVEITQHERTISFDLKSARLEREVLKEGEDDE